MRTIFKILLSSVIGGLVCAISGFAVYLIMALFDNAKVTEEAFLFAVVVAIVCTFIGAIVGFVVGVSNVGYVGGGIIGLLAIVAIGLLSGPNTTIVFVVGTIPMITAGVAAALPAKLLSKPRQTTPQTAPVAE